MKVFALVQKFCDDEDGVTAIEYGLLAALVGVALIGGATILGDNLNAFFTALAGVAGTLAAAI